MVQKPANQLTAWLAFGLLIYAILLLDIGCQGGLVDNLFEGYEDVSAPYPTVVQQAVEVASAELIRLDKDTADFGVSVLQDSLSCWVIFSEKPPPGTVLGRKDSTITVWLGREYSIRISKDSLNILDVYVCH